MNFTVAGILDPRTTGRGNVTDTSGYIVQSPNMIRLKLAGTVVVGKLSSGRYRMSGEDAAILNLFKNLLFPVYIHEALTSEKPPAYV